MTDPTTAVSTLTTIAAIIEKMDSWHPWTILVVMFLLPTILMFCGGYVLVRVMRSLETRIIDSDHRIETLVQNMTIKYDNNIKLVEDYSKLVRDYRAYSDTALEHIKESTKAMTSMSERINVAIGKMK